jgi:uncharacterized protein (DUF58 family)/TM2 domain-containing membrane protein YozV
MTPAKRPLRYKPTSSLAKESVVLAWFFLGWLGVHRMILGSAAIGAVYAGVSVMTCGLFGFFGWIDGFILLLGTPRDAHGLPVVWSWKRGKLLVDPLEEGSYAPAEAVLRILGNVALLFLLPYIVVACGLVLFEAGQVEGTARKLAIFATVILAPLFLVQVLGTVKKARAQIALLQKASALTSRTRLDAIARAASILTPRGMLVLVTGVAFLVLSLKYRWAELGVIAVLALAAFYLVTSVAAVWSAFVVGRFSDNLLARGAVVHRQFAPGVVRAGDPATDTLDVKGVPVPPDFFLTLGGALPPRLATEVRHVVPPKPRDERLSLASQVRRTPRGTYDVPPLRIAFTDLLGLTSAPVASLATARLRILPAVRPAEIFAPPPTRTEAPDILSRPHRFPTEDLFRFREYVAGDDTRRIHWEMSLRAGRMIVKTPDSRESSAKRVVVALDTWVPLDWLDHATVLDDALDALAEAWLAVAQKLVDQGEKVTLLLVCRADDGTLRPEIVGGHANHAHALDAGARAEWQSQFRIEDVLDIGVKEARAEGDTPFDNAVVITMRLVPPQLPRVARETTWVYYDPADALGPLPRSSFELWVDYDDSGRRASFGEFAKRALLLPYPVGSEENGIIARVKGLERRLEDRAHRLALRWRAVACGRNALGALLASPDAVYRLSLEGGRHRLVGLKGSYRRSA